MTIQFDVGKSYVCKHGNVWKLAFLYKSDCSAIEFLDFELLESFNADCTGKEIELTPNAAREYFISEFKGSFSEELQLINWKHPDQPGYMEFVNPPGEEKPAEKVGHKHDDGKPMFTCLPPLGLIKLGHVGALGAHKYGLHNYRNGIQVSRLLDAAFRHLIAAVNGEEKDQIDGNDHLASAAWNCLAAIQTIADHPELDDRYRR